MSELQPYSPGATGTLADVVEQGPELRQLKPAGPDSFAIKPSWSQLFSAARPEALRSTPGYDDSKIGSGYAPIIDALGLPASENPGYFQGTDAAGEARFGALGSPSNLATAARIGEKVPFGSSYLADRAVQESLVVDQIRARRAKEPNFLPGVPDTAEGLHQYFEQQQAKQRAAGGAVLARGSTFGRITAGLAAGGLESGINDPTFLPLMALGGGTASSVLQAAGRDALINGVLATAQLPVQAHNMAENDEHLTVGDAVSNVTSAAALGAIAGGAIHLGATHVPPLLFKAMPDRVQARWAARMKVGDGKDAPLLHDVLADMDNRELAGFARSTIGTRMTPDERAAADVIERSQELGEGSPFEPGPAGDAAHNANLGATFKAVVDGDPTTSPKADLLGSSSPIALRPIAVPRHAGFDAQWSAIKGNEHGIGSHGEFLTSPKGAIGPAQVMPGTAPYAAKLAGVPFDEQRYRTDAAYNEQLGRAYYAEQLQTFGDPAMAAAAYNAGPGSAARGTGLRGALRRAAEHGEPGNWEAYLPHETQRYVADFRRRTGAIDNGADRAIASGAGDDEIAGLQRSADDAEAEAIALNRERAHAEDLADRSSIEEVPLLKRELFGSDNEWLDAQAAFHASLNAPEGPPASGARQPEGVESAPGAPQTLQQWFGGSLIADEHGRPLTVYHGSGSEFDTFDVGRSGEGRGSTDERALFFSTDPDVASHSAMVAGAGHATGEPTHTGAFSDNGGVVYPVHLRLENPLISKLKFYNGEEFAQEIARAKAAGHDGVIFPHVKSRGENGTIAVFRPEQVRSIFAGAADVRIDEPALKAFDDGGSGRSEQVDSLEHDARLAAADPELGKRSYVLAENGKPQTVGEILEQLDRERDAVAALRACAGAA